MDIESILQKENFYMTVAKGVSMLPLIRAGRDTVCLVKPEPPLLPMEVLLYRMDGKYVLHRLIKINGGRCVFLGDNCVTLELVDEKQVVGRLKLLYRDEKEINPDSLLLRLYTFFWARPWRLRVFILKIRNRLKSMIGRLHAKK